MGYNSRQNDTEDLVPNFAQLTVLNIVFLTALLMNGIVYLIILDNQIVLKLLKRVF